MSSFRSPGSVSAASISSQVKEGVDQEFQDLLEEMEIRNLAIQGRGREGVRDLTARL